jgi:hypothetical protein
MTDAERRVLQALIDRKPPVILVGTAKSTLV